MARRKLQRRERIGIAMAVAVVAFAGVVPLVRNASEKHARAAAQVEQARQRLEQVRSLRAGVEGERARHRLIEERIVRRPPQFDLYSFTDTCLRDLNLKSRAKLSSKGGPYGAKNQDEIEMTLEGISREELVTLLHRIYASDNLIALQRLNHLRNARDGKGLECQMTLISPKT